MADREKIRKLFENADIMKQFDIFNAEIAHMLRERFENEASVEDISDMIVFQKRMMEFVNEKVTGFLTQIFEEHFTDEDIDELIAVYSSRVFRKMSALAPVITTRLFSLILDGENEIFAEIVKLAEREEGSGGRSPEDGNASGGGLMK